MVQPLGQTECGVNRTEVGRHTCAGYRPWAQGAAALSNLKAGRLENEFEFWPDFTIKLIPNGSCRPLLFSDLILGESSRQSPRPGTSISLPSAIMSG